MQKWQSLGATRKDTFLSASFLCPGPRTFACKHKNSETLAWHPLRECTDFYRGRRHIATLRQGGKLIAHSLSQHATHGCFSSPLTPSKGRMGYLLKTPAKSVKVRPFIFVILTICNILYYTRSPITSSRVNPSSVLDIPGCSLYTWLSSLFCFMRICSLLATINFTLALSSYGTIQNLLGMFFFLEPRRVCDDNLYWNKQKQWGVC